MWNEECVMKIKKSKSKGQNYSSKFKVLNFTFQFCVLIFALLTFSIPLISDEWRSLGNDTQRLRRSGETSIDETLTLAWKYTLPSGRSIISSPVVSDGLVIFGAEDGKVYALDIAASNSLGSPVFGCGG